jgi:hypothetical protein
MSSWKFAPSSLSSDTACNYRNIQTWYIINLSCFVTVAKQLITLPLLNFSLVDWLSMSRRHVSKGLRWRMSGDKLSILSYQWYQKCWTSLFNWEILHLHANRDFRGCTAPSVSMLIEKNHV